MPYKDSEQQRLAVAEWQRANPDMVNAKSRRWKEQNSEHCKAYAKQQKRVKRAYYTALQANRRAAQYNATPPWADREAILRTYENCPTGYEVDHIVPLLGKNVCGLHVSWNLQIIPKSDNRSKSNKLDEVLCL